MSKRAVMTTVLSLVIGWGGVLMGMPILFSVTGTANENRLGYTQGESYTFTLILNSSFLNNASCLFSADQNYWGEDTLDDTAVWTDVAGDGLTGSYVRPADDYFAPYAFLFTVAASQSLTLGALNDASGGVIGLQAGGEDINSLYVDSLVLGDIFTFPASYTDPAVYFAGGLGTYAALGGEISLTGAETGSLIFTATSVTIEAVPEPASALMIGLGGALIAGYRRFFGRA